MKIYSKAQELGGGQFQGAGMVTSPDQGRRLGLFGFAGDRRVGRASVCLYDLGGATTLEWLGTEQVVGVNRIMEERAINICLSRGVPRENVKVTRVSLKMVGF